MISRHFRLVVRRSINSNRKNEVAITTPRMLQQQQHQQHQQRIRIMQLHLPCFIDRTKYSNSNRFATSTIATVSHLSRLTVSSCRRMHVRQRSSLLQLHCRERRDEVTQNRPPIQRRLSSFSTISSSYSFKGEKLRVAIIGGGCAGLATALHLAPFVDENGWISGPIDIYETKPVTSRDIGVGIWSTALQSFRDISRTSHQAVYNHMISNGTWLGEVGYRTPNGAWLLKSQLPTNEMEMDERDMPSLLFLRERDMLESLQEAVHWEEHHQGTIRVHNAGRVEGLYEESNQPWSTNLILGNNNNNTSSNTISDRDYHLIVAADGMHSIIRRMYGGHENDTRRLIGTSALPSPNDLPPIITDSTLRNWDQSQHDEIVGLQDRNYTVFRGNAHISREVLYQDANSPSYQTWGTDKSMRFATVPMFCPSPQGREERQVWFMTINNDAVIQESDPVKRRDMLLHEFRDWHDPIRQTVLATPPEEILMERAVAHRHCTGPVLEFNSKVVPSLRGRRPPSSGEGPCIVFVGDSYMTVDPILAQGFTMAMESGAALRQSIARSFDHYIPPTILSTTTSTKTTNTPNTSYESDTTATTVLSFDPIQLRHELKKRQVSKMDRLICLLRVTEIVQALGQPTTKWTGMFNTMILRPIIQLIPNGIKAPIFDMVLRYSLGLGLWKRKKMK